MQLVQLWNGSKTCILNIPKWIKIHPLYLVRMQNRAILFRPKWNHLCYDEPKTNFHFVHSEKLHVGDLKFSQYLYGTERWNYISRFLSFDRLEQLHSCIFMLMFVMTLQRTLSQIDRFKNGSMVKFNDDFCLVHNFWPSIQKSISRYMIVYQDKHQFEILVRNIISKHQFETSVEKLFQAIEWFESWIFDGL